MQLAAPPPRLYRAADGRVAAGVAQGLANHLAVKPLYVRIAFAVLDLRSTASASWSTWRCGRSSRSSRSPRTPRRAAAAGRSSAAPRSPWSRSPPAACCWPAAYPSSATTSCSSRCCWPAPDSPCCGARPTRTSATAGGGSRCSSTEPTRRSIAIVRFAGGAMLVAAGVGSFLLLSGTLSAARDGLVAGVAVLAGLALLTAPLWWRLVADLSRGAPGADPLPGARRPGRPPARLGAADAGADPAARRRAARGGPAGPRPGARAADLALPPGGPAGVQARRRRWRRSPARSRTRTWCRSRAWSSATPRWTTGSARWCRRPGRRWSTRPSTPASGTISLYAEVEPEEVTVFVRDRGAGFDPDAVGEDRHGVRGSIVGRMERHGGKATIRSRPSAPARRSS